MISYGGDAFLSPVSKLKCTLSEIRTFLFWRWAEITGSLAGAQGADCTAAGNFCWRGVVTVFQGAADRRLEMNHSA